MVKFTDTEIVPKKYWQEVLKLIENEVSCGGGYGTHCSNDEYLLNGWLYDILYEGTTVIHITRKKVK